MSTLQMDRISDAFDKRAVYLRASLGILFSFVRSLLLARFLLPNDMSAFRIGTSWVGYFGFLTLGTVDTYFFRAPSLLNTGNASKALRLQSVALMMVLLTAFVSNLGTIVLALKLHLTDFGSAALLGLNGLCASIMPYLSIAFWAKSQFQRQARVEILVSFIGVVLGMGGLLLLGLRGLLIGNSLSYITAFILARDLFPFGSIHLAVIQDYVESIRFGIKQSLVVFMQGLVNSVDLQILALLIVGRAEMGVYAFATMLAVAIRTAVTAGAVVSQTKLLIQHGDTSSTLTEDLCREAEHQRRLDNALVTILGLVAFGVIVAFAPVAFPLYANAIEPLAALILSIIILRWGFFHAVALMSRSMQSKVMPTVIMGILIASAWAYISVRCNWPLSVIALAPCFGAAIYSILTVIVSEQTLAGHWLPMNLLNMVILLVGPVFMLGVSATNRSYTNVLWVIFAIIVYLVTLALLDRKTLFITLQFFSNLAGASRWFPSLLNVAKYVK